MARDRTLVFCRAMLDVARARFAECVVEFGPGDRRTRDARESVAGWVREVEKWERREQEEAA